MTVTALVGGQYGSEGKGLIAAKIANHYAVHVRTGAPNAGHTYYIDEVTQAIDTPVMRENAEPTGERIKVVARSVPVGASNPYAHLVIGAGGMIDLDLLAQEVSALDAMGLAVSDRLYVDRRAMVVDRHRHHGFEGGVHGHAHKTIGSTGEGVGPARMAQIVRGTFPNPAPSWSIIAHAGDDGPSSFLADYGITVHDDTSRLINSWIDVGQSVLLEGTQGSGLSLTHGEWPYVTSTDTNAGQLCVDAGISPKRLTNVILVARTFPIRVAGNSGPLYDETSFEDIGVAPEFTTVTKKQRRIGRWDHDLFSKAVRLNGPLPSVALTFADYMWPDLANVDKWHLIWPIAGGWIENMMEDRHGCMVDFIGTGPDSVAVNPRSAWRTSL